MWKRNTWHECASELESISDQFRYAFWNKRYGGGWPRHSEAEKTMITISQDGVKILRSLALAIRSEQDFDLIPDEISSVGLIKSGIIGQIDINYVKQNGGFNGLSGNCEYKGIRLREALNKIAHANPNLSGFYVGAGNEDHDIILTGNNRSRDWIAVISLKQLIKAVKSIDDISLNN